MQTMQVEASAAIGSQDMQSRKNSRRIYLQYYSTHPVGPLPNWNKSRQTCLQNSTTCQWPEIRLCQKQSFAHLNFDPAMDSVRSWDEQNWSKTISELGTEHKSKKTNCTHTALRIKHGTVVHNNAKVMPICLDDSNSTKTVQDTTSTWNLKSI